MAETVIEPKTPDEVGKLLTEELFDAYDSGAELTLDVAQWLTEMGRPYDGSDYPAFVGAAVFAFREHLLAEQANVEDAIREYHTD